MALRCPICWEDMTSPTITPCGHNFCQTCIRAALEVKKECPVCRVFISCHRKLREDPTFYEALHQGAESQDSRMLLAESTSQLAMTWACVTCTLENADALSRCAACNSRRPSEHVSRPQEPEQRFAIVSAQPRKTRRRSDREDDSDEVPREDDSDEVAQAAEAAAAVPQATSGANDNFDFCSICGRGGLLVCCDVCPHAYHAACLGSNAPPEDEDEESTWWCPPCKRVSTTTKKQRLVATNGKGCAGTGPALASTAATSPHAQPLQPGVRVWAKYLASDPAMRRRYGPTRWYMGTIHASNADGTDAVAYDDGDFEASVLPKYIRHSPQAIQDASGTGEGLAAMVAEADRREPAGGGGSGGEGGSAWPLRMAKTSARHGSLGFASKSQGDGHGDEINGMVGGCREDNDEPPDGEPWPLVRSLLGSNSGYMNVRYNPLPRAKKQPYQAVREDGKSLGMFRTAEEAAEALSRWLGYKVAKEKARCVDIELAARQTRKRMTPDEALQIAQREGLTLLKSTRDEGRTTPYRGVYKLKGDHPRSFFAKFWYNGKKHSLGCFFTAEEAALEVARGLVEAKRLNGNALA